MASSRVRSVRGCNGISLRKTSPSLLGNYFRRRVGVRYPLVSWLSDGLLADCPEIGITHDYYELHVRSELLDNWAFKTHDVVDCGPINFFLCVLLLFQFEYVFVKVKVQIFVCIVDAKLLETIFDEIFEAKNIENRNGSRLFRALVDYVIDSSYQPRE